MQKRKIDKNKVLGLSMVLLILFWLFSWFIPHPGLNNILVNEKKTDSIRIVDHLSREAVSIVDSERTHAIFMQLRTAVEISPLNPKGGRIIFVMEFFSNGKKEDIELMDSKQDGRIIHAGFAYFRSDSLWGITKSYF